MYTNKEYKIIKERISTVVEWMNGFPEEPTTVQLDMFEAYKKEFEALQTHVKMILLHHGPTNKLRLLQ